HGEKGKAVGLSALAGLVHAGGVDGTGLVEDAVLVGVPIVDEDVVVAAVEVGLGHEVGRGRAQSNVAAVGADGGGAYAVVVALCTVLAHADAPGARRDAIMHEDVVDAIGVPWHEVARVRLEDDVTAVGAEIGIDAPAVGLSAGAAEADAAGGGLAR